jgi:hypothetical protein
MINCFNEGTLKNDLMYSFVNGFQYHIFGKSYTFRNNQYPVILLLKQFLYEYCLYIFEDKVKQIDTDEFMDY